MFRKCSLVGHTDCFYFSLFSPDTQPFKISKKSECHNLNVQISRYILKNHYRILTWIIISIMWAPSPPFQNYLQGCSKEKSVMTAIVRTHIRNDSLVFSSIWGRAWTCPICPFVRWELSFSHFMERSSRELEERDHSDTFPAEALTYDCPSYQKFE